MMKMRIKKLLIILGSFVVLSGCGKEEMVYFPTQSDNHTYESTVREEETLNQIMVHVCGAVKEPGVISVEENARIIDAVLMAGGMMPEADESYVNLAEKVTDGQKIYIPTCAEVAEWENLREADSLININTANKDELCTLPGIGESKADDIISYREKNGSFKTKEELMNISGIKENLFERIADKIKVE